MNIPYIDSVLLFLILVFLVRIDYQIHKKSK